MENEHEQRQHASKTAKGVGVSSTPEVDIRALASLSRIALSEEESVHMEAEVRGILGFVKAVQDAPIARSEEEQTLPHAMREDTASHEPGAYSQALLAAAPMREGDQVEVKQVLQHVKKGGNSESS